jgi:hypothetical protein
VIDRAKTILTQLESDDTSVSLPAPQAKPKKKITVAPADDSQLNLLRPGSDGDSRPRGRSEQVASPLVTSAPGALASRQG